MLRNNITKYGLIAKIFHWATFLFLIIQIPFGFYISDLEFSVERMNFENYHNIGGIIIFYVVLARLIWKFFNPSPKNNSTVIWQVLLAKLNHFLLYLFVIVIVISGVLKKFFIEEPVNMLFFNLQSSKTIFKLSDIFNELHEVGVVILIGLILLHVFAVIYHHVFLKDKILKKIL